MEKLKTHIGQTIKQHVKEHRVSQAAWARRQGVNQQAVWRYQKQPSMRVDTLFTICQMLNKKH
ncbi:MAG TPA: hypothetical protein VI757_00560 [Bacteroidia bacterium]|nr:hypothetical protein [Bacteroidia bacterium]